MSRHKLGKKSWQGAGRKREVLSVKAALADFLAKRDGSFRLHLNALWLNWDIVLGDDLAGLGKPLSYKNKILIIGAEDSMALQDLSMQATDILERANAFMNQEYFEKIRVVLMQGKRALNEARVPRSPRPPARPLPRPPRLGGLMGRLPDDFPLKDCYETYCKLFGLEGGRSGD